MDAPIRPDKNLVITLVTQFAPEFLEILADCKNADTWRKLADRWSAVCKRWKIENYVLLYEDERRIHAALFNAVMSPQEQSARDLELAGFSQAERQNAINEMVRPGGEWDQLSDALFPSTPEAEREQVRAFEALSEDERKEAVISGQFLLAASCAFFHEALAVMVHGERMTSLVPKALAGDREAYGKAVHIDKSLFREHPGFRKIYDKALAEGDKSFVVNIACRQAAPVSQGRIRLPGVFVVFSLLESMGWLNDFRHREILDICDAAKLDRFHSRIEDETALGKCLGKYRAYQKSCGLSMH